MPDIITYLFGSQRRSIYENLIDVHIAHRPGLHVLLHAPRQIGPGLFLLAAHKKCNTKRSIGATQKAV